MPTLDIWVAAQAAVDNKSFFSKVAHMGALHKYRSAVSSSGSFKSKAAALMGTAAKSLFSLIPLPAVGSILSAAQGVIESKVRVKLHQSHNPKMAAEHRKMMSDVESVKFALKEINIEVLDRYRWKLEDSVKEMVAESQKYDTKYAKADKDSKPCNAQYELAYAIAQAERRLNKFEREVSGLLAIAQASLVFAEKARVSVIDYKNQASLNFAASADTEVKICNLGHSLSEKEEMKMVLLSTHANCDKFCYYHNALASSQYSGNPSAGPASYISDTAKYVSQTLKEPYSTESFLSVYKLPTE